jgi:hypothetical protein
LELFEGKARPPWKEAAEFEDLFNTNTANTTKVGSLILRMAKPLFDTGAIVVHDSGFSFIPAMKALLTKGVHSSMLCKKKKYFPRFTDGKSNAVFLMQQDYLVHFHKRMRFEDVIWQMNMYRDTAHLVQLASSYGGGNLSGPERFRFHPTSGRKITFKHGDAVDDYFYARSAVDEHNRTRQGILSFEQGWQTKKWHVRMFAFLVGMSETNARNAAIFFASSPRTTQSVYWTFDCLLRSIYLISMQRKHALPPEKLPASCATCMGNTIFRRFRWAAGATRARATVNMWMGLKNSPHHARVMHINANFASAAGKFAHTARAIPRSSCVLSATRSTTWS